MINETSGKEDILLEIGIAVNEISNLYDALDDSTVNQIPYPDSWTASQLCDHVTKSIAGVAASMETKGIPFGGNTGARIPELKKAFLDFTIKMKSPDFIIPDEGPFKKMQVNEDLNNAFSKFRLNAVKADLNEKLEGLPLGPVTKLELLHFVLYHTLRHVHQMHKIWNALQPM